jgi:hypothetical protein
MQTSGLPHASMQDKENQLTPCMQGSAMRHEDKENQVMYGSEYCNHKSM